MTSMIAQCVIDIEAGTVKDSYHGTDGASFFSQARLISESTVLDFRRRKRKSDCHTHLSGKYCSLATAHTSFYTPQCHRSSPEPPSDACLNRQQDARELCFCHSDSRLFADRNIISKQCKTHKISLVFGIIHPCNMDFL